mmetsp:Transcript_51172/g.91968  ORF Transcript_51172/g.91968 Transcript_51172/m.91968 type:complete len:520 (-) Transcript_51172:39-1598(-)
MVKRALSDELSSEAPGKPVFVRTLAGGGPGSSSTDLEGRSSANLVGCSVVAFSRDGTAIFFNDQKRIRKLDLGTGLVATLASLEGVTACCQADDGWLYLATRNTIQAWSPVDGSLSLVAGGAPGLVNATGRSAGFENIKGMTFDGNQRLAVVDGNCIRRCTKQGVVTTVCGSSNEGHVDGAAAAALFKQPRAITYDTHDGSFHVADTGNHRIRKISSDFQVCTRAGDGQTQHKDGRATGASLHSPTAVASVGDWVYFLESGSHTVRCISPTGEVTTVAGQVGTGGFADAFGKSALLGVEGASCICTDRSGHYVFVDYFSSNTTSWYHVHLREFHVDQTAGLKIGKSCLQSDLARLLNDSSLGDLTVLAKDGKASHSLRGLLRLRSEYFRAMLDSGFKEGSSARNEIRLEHSFQAVQCILHFLHTDELNVSDEAILEVLQMAEMMNLVRLKSLLEAEIMLRIGPSNACTFFASADCHGASALRAHCLSYVANHLGVVRQQENFQELPKDLLLEVIMAQQI